MKRSITALAVTAIALAGALSMWPSPAAASHDDCTVSVNPPSLWRNYFVEGFAQIDCATTKNTIRQSFALTRDGVEVNRVDYTCHRQNGCWTYVSANDVLGSDEAWCVHYTVRVGPHSLGTITRCEAESF